MTMPGRVLSCTSHVANQLMLEDLAARWSAERVFEPQMSQDRRAELYDGWCAAVRTVTGGPR